MSKPIALTAGLLLVAGLGVAQAHDHKPAPPRWGDPVHTVSAPEIEAASAGAALVLLAGGMYVLFRRRTTHKD